ncbi:MAG: STAS domain-containing protein [Calothrix sp. MO_167.B42]|nr:STAS domain-containing protein [Calothrix sp. MO_167.B42]
MTNEFKIVQPSGILDGQTTNNLRREIIDLVEGGANVILVDLQEVTFMNSSGIGALVAAFKAVRAANSQMYLCSLSDQLQMIFQLTKMEKVFKIFQNRDEFADNVMSLQG